MAFLTVMRGNDPGRTISLDRDRIVLGRGIDCDAILGSAAVGRQVAQIVREGDIFFLEDLRSRNGLLLNSEPLRGRARLRDNDLIRIADWVLRFQNPEVAPAGRERTRWEAAATELRAHRDRQRRTWAGLDDATVGRCLAGEATPAEMQRLAAALDQHAEVREVIDLVRGALAEDTPPPAGGRPAL